MNINTNKILSDLNSYYQESIASNPSTPLSEQQKSYVRAIFTELNNAESTEIDFLVEKLATHPQIASIVSTALAGSGESSVNLTEKLAESFLNEFSYEYFGDSNQSNPWLIRNKSRLTKEGFDHLSDESKIYLTALLAKLPEQEEYHGLFQHTNPAYLDFFRSAKSSDINALLSSIPADITENDKWLFVALHLSINKIAIKEFIEAPHLNAIMPHLRYGNFYAIDDKDKILELLEFSKKLNYILIQNDRITELTTALPNCQILNCKNCPHLSKLPTELPNCKILNCSNCPQLTELPELLNCQILYCSHCTGLTQLPELPNCQTLYCIACSGLTRLPELSNCKTLYCTYCNSLTELPRLPKYEELYCSYCPLLTELPGLLNCQMLYCSYCTGLTQLPELPNCEILTCVACPQLTQLPATLPNCQSLDCSGCPQLRGAMPEVPASCQVVTSESPSFQYRRLTVNIDLLNNNPIEVLLTLGREYLLQNQAFPNIDYDGSVAIDAGGVRRDFISRLMRALFSEQQQENRLIRDKEYRPSLNPAENNQDLIDSYRTIGRILGLCFPHHSMFKPGQIFSEIVFKEIAGFSNPVDPTPEDWARAYLIRMGLPLSILQIGETSNKNDIMNAIHLYDEETKWDETSARAFFNERENQKNLLALIVGRGVKDPLLMPIQVMAKEIQLLLGEKEWAELRAEPYLMDRIQGTVTKDAVLGAIRWTHAPNVTAANLTKTTGFVTNWLDRAKPEQLKEFVYGVTGNNAIGDRTEIQIAIFNHEKRVPVAHTCFYQFVLSAEFDNQAEFDEKIGLFLANLSHGTRFEFA